MSDKYKYVYIVLHTYSEVCFESMRKYLEKTKGFTRKESLEDLNGPIQVYEYKGAKVVLETLIWPYNDVRIRSEIPLPFMDNFLLSNNRYFDACAFTEEYKDLTKKGLSAPDITEKTDIETETVAKITINSSEIENKQRLREQYYHALTAKTNKK